MSINITGRQFVVTPEIKEYVLKIITPVAETVALKTSCVNVVMNRSGNRFQTAIVFNCKYHVFTSAVEDYDLYKSIDACWRKVLTQLDNLRDRVVDHRLRAAMV